MDKTVRFRSRLLTGMFVLMGICAGFGALKYPLPYRQSGMSLIGWMICCVFQGGEESPIRAEPDPLVHMVILGILSYGAAILLLGVIRTRHRIARLFEKVNVQGSEDKLAPLLSRMNLHRQVAVLQSPLPLAFCFGFLKPRICLSSGLIEALSPEQLEAALLHEEYHRRSVDPLRLLIVETLAKMLFFLPLVAEWGEMIKVRLEVAADNFAAGVVGKPALAGALHRMMAVAAPHPSPGTGVFIARFGANAARVAALLGDKRRPFEFSGAALMKSTFSLAALCLSLMV